MDLNAPLTTPEPTPEPILEPTPEITPERKIELDAEKKPVASFTSGIISLVLGLITWVVFSFWWLLDIKLFFAGLIAFLSAVLAIFFGAKAKRENPGSKAGKAGRILGWLYIIGMILLIILVVLGVVLGISALSGMFS